MGGLREWLRDKLRDWLGVTDNLAYVMEIHDTIADIQSERMAAREEAQRNHEAAREAAITASQAYATRFEGELRTRLLEIDDHLAAARKEGARDYAKRRFEDLLENHRSLRSQLGSLEETCREDIKSLDDAFERLEINFNETRRYHREAINASACDHDSHKRRIDRALARIRKVEDAVGIKRGGKKAAGRKK